MKERKKRLSKTGGFTLVEMLIVVAIIAILIAVSIPLVNNSLEKTRDSTDLANERAAKAEAVIVYLGMAEVEGYTLGSNGPLYYDAAAGKLVPDRESITAYGKCSQDHKNDDVTFADGKSGPHNNEESGIIEVTINDDGTVSMVWGISDGSDPGGDGEGGGGSTDPDDPGPGPGTDPDPGPGDDEDDEEEEGFDFDAWLTEQQDSDFKTWYDSLGDTGDEGKVKSAIKNLSEEDAVNFANA